MSTVKGQTTIKYVRQGDSLTCTLRSTFPLKQFISNGNNIVTPSFAENKPCIYPVVRSSLKATRIEPSASGVEWRYNGQEIAFDASGLSKAMGNIPAGTFKSETKNVDGFTVPTLTIQKEVASSGNIDSDTIEFKGTVNTGFQSVVSSSIEISIEQTDGESCLGYITINNGGVIDDSTAQLNATAHFMIGGVEKTDGVSYKWFRMKVVNGADGWEAINKTSACITITASDVNSSELYKCEMTYGGKSSSAVMEVSDETDILIIYPNPTDSAGDSVPEELSTAQTSIVYRPKVYKRSTGTEVSGFTFNYLLTDAAGDTIASQDGGSSFTVTIDHAAKAGGDMTLIISAE